MKKKTKVKSQSYKANAHKCLKYAIEAGINYYITNIWKHREFPKSYEEWKKIEEDIKHDLYESIINSFYEWFDV